MLYRDPCVYVVEQEYQIIFNCLEKGIAWVQVGEKTYRDTVDGMFCSEELIHRVHVPMAELDAARSYTVCFRALPERRPYFPELGEMQAKTYAFTPAPQDASLRMLLMSDTHSMVAEPTAAAALAGEFDLLVLAGDIPAESKTPEDIRAIYDITSNVTHGEKPVLFVQGNHDYRGRLATELGKYVGRRSGCSWFTFRLGALWGVVLDCAEDKDDSNEEYGGVVDCHSLRLRETEWLREVAAHADETYNAPGITTRLAFCHIPFPTGLICLPFISGQQMENGGDPRFDIEPEIYCEWTELLCGMKLNAMLSAHTHALSLTRPESPAARYGMNFPMLIGCAPERPDKTHPDRPYGYTCTLLTLTPASLKAEILTHKGERKAWCTVYGE